MKRSFFLTAAMLAGAALLILAMVAGTGSARAQDAPVDPAALIEAAAAEADEFERWLRDGRIGDNRLEKTRAALDDRRSALSALAERFVGDLAPLLNARSTLGPPPEAGSEEAPEIAEKRAVLDARIAALETLQRRAKLALARAAGLADRLRDLRRERFTSQLLRRGPSPASPERISGAWESISLRAAAVAREVSARLAHGSGFSLLIDRMGLSLILAIAAIVIGVKAHRWLIGRVRTVLRDDVAGPARARASMGIAATRLILPVIGIVAVVGGLRQSGLLGPNGEHIVDALALAGAVVVGTFALSTAYFAPWTPMARLSSLDDDAARASHRWLMILALAVALDRLLVVPDKDIRLTLDALTVINAVLLMVGGLALWRFVRASGLSRQAGPGTRTGGEIPAGSDEDIGRAGAVLRMAPSAIAIAAPVLALLGYYGASRFIFYPPILSAALLGVSILIYRWTRGLTEKPAPAETDDGAEPPTAPVGVIPVAVGFVLAMTMAPLVALIWGAEAVDLRMAWRAIVEGIAIGNVVVSPVDFGIFAIVFAIGYFVNRVVQGVLRRSVMPLVHLDDGGKAALLSGIGYTGIVIVALVAISTTGLDLSNVALVAGALSVGIGFGLQNVVNNFISGIILLVERPIKVGDWVEIAGTHGTVRKINVRSTAIQKFDRSTIFVPNADLISGTVTNYYHGERTGRMILKIGVAYGSDARKVEKILVEIAKAHPMLAKKPAPYVLFTGFGDNSLDFQIRGIMNDVDTVTTLPSELRYAIYERFTEEGIEIPFAQRDVHIKNIADLRGAFGARPDASGDE